MVSRYIRVALLHFTQHCKDVKIDTMIRNTIVALVLLLSAASVNAALIPVNVEVTGIQDGYFYQGYGVGTYNIDTTEILVTHSGAGVTFYGGDYYLEGETEILGLLVRERALSCAPTDIFLCTSGLSYEGADRQVASNTVNEFGSGTVIGVISNQFYTAQTTYSISPVPLPAAAWLFISAIAGLAGAKRLSRSKGSA
jgi:hypothetical protein